MSADTSAQSVHVVAAGGVAFFSYSKETYMPTPDFLYGSIALSNSTDNLILKDSTGITTDSVYYTSTGWPGAAGKSMTLDPAHLDKSNLNPPASTATLPPEEEESHPSKQEEERQSPRDAQKRRSTAGGGVPVDLQSVERSWVKGHAIRSATNHPSLPA